MRLRLHCAVWLFMTAAMFSSETIDRIVATVNGRPVMESELTEQIRVEQLLAGKPPDALPADEQRSALGRLVDQVLLEEQMNAVNFARPGAGLVARQVQELRLKVAPQADAWRHVLARYGLSEEDLSEHIAMQLRTLQFIDARFRPAVRVDPAAVEVYYREQLAPRMKQAGAQPEPMKNVEPRIREILVQQQMDDLLESWLKTLRLQTEIRLPAPSSSLGAVPPNAQTHAAEVR